jgi:hypothetical protein
MRNVGRHLRQVSERTGGSSYITPVRVAAAESNINSQIFPEKATPVYD